MRRGLRFVLGKGAIAVGSAGPRGERRRADVGLVVRLKVAATFDRLG